MTQMEAIASQNMSYEQQEELFVDRELNKFALRTKSVNQSDKKPFRSVIRQDYA